jgi:hypothetical protein
MRLFEFADDDPLRVKLAGVATQLKANSNEPMPLDEFIEILRSNGVSIDEGDIFDIIKKEPLVNIVQDIEDKQVVFKGQQGEFEEPGPDENEKIRQSMASKQASKLG